MLTIKKSKATVNRQFEELTVEGVLIERLEEAAALLVDVLADVKVKLQRGEFTTFKPNPVRPDPLRVTELNDREPALDEAPEAGGGLTGVQTDLGDHFAETKPVRTTRS